MTKEQQISRAVRALSRDKAPNPIDWGSIPKALKVVNKADAVLDQMLFACTVIKWFSVLMIGGIVAGVAWRSYWAIIIGG